MASMHYAMDVPSQDRHTLDVDAFAYMEPCRRR